ncbi:hypothetical protein [Ktedonobacter robiniae]|uniref:hypothetical protein n=1 Tax=Ktedonobacter robiniae TaxID=2778365 RepID=UPI001915E03E|nr:hypothetical protein [Ktedonobacter robiniae]
MPHHLFFQLSIAGVENKLSLKSGMAQNRPEKNSHTFISIITLQYHCITNLAPHIGFLTTETVSHREKRVLRLVIKSIDKPFFVWHTYPRSNDKHTKLLSRSRHVYISAIGRPENSENEKTDFEKALQKGLTNPRRCAILPEQSTSEQKQRKHCKSSKRPTHKRQAYGFAGLRFNNKKKNEPEHPEQLKSGMQKYNGTSLVEHVSIAENTVPVNSANKAMK